MFYKHRRKKKTPTSTEQSDERSLILFLAWGFGDASGSIVGIFFDIGNNDEYIELNKY